MKNSEEMNGDELARACADAMWKNDKASSGLGMELGVVSQGMAQLSMVVRDDMTNGHNICHGGFIFTLADSAFAFACNGYNQFTVAQHCSISFLKSAKLGEKLTAVAIERQRQGRSGLYDISVTNEADEIIAEFRGISRTIKGQHLQQN
ncbi:MAG: hydroxyphenylacetyl-CoA thioesterase PaaI [Rhizobiaceae bacterium]|nr:hydroxyphenylacetyl-CoA thioesterase PaaI [Rhizobiaceae bacterium]